MGQEFFINSQALEDKIRTSLPSQGGAGAGFDLSASTQIIPIIDLTETASGSVLRQDLQTSFSLTTITEFSVNNTTTTLVNNTGYWRCFVNVTLNTGGFGEIRLTDGVTTKDIVQFGSTTTTQNDFVTDFIVFLEAGESLVAYSANANFTLAGNTRQIASIDGTLVNP
tara:strand:- start:337 stop:840 length:504 start_codon:yes stop_codon:yes gene_type:complete